MKYKIVLIILYVLVINVVAFVLMGVDKYKAQHYRYRIRERMLLLAAVLGGSVGAILGMLLFRHKTCHSKFYIGLPTILGLQIIVIIAVLIAR